MGELLNVLTGDDTAVKPETGKRDSQATTIVELVTHADAELWHTPAGDGYMTLKVNGTARITRSRAEPAGTISPDCSTSRPVRPRTRAECRMRSPPSPAWRGLMVPSTMSLSVSQVTYVSM